MTNLLLLFLIVIITTVLVIIILNLAVIRAFQNLFFLYKNVYKKLPNFTFYCTNVCGNKVDWVVLEANWTEVICRCTSYCQSVQTMGMGF